MICCPERFTTLPALLKRAPVVVATLLSVLLSAAAPLLNDAIAPVVNVLNAAVPRLAASAAALEKSMMFDAALPTVMKLDN